MKRKRCRKHVKLDIDNTVVEYDDNGEDGGCWLCIYARENHDYEMALHRVYELAERLAEGVARPDLVARQLIRIVNGAGVVFDDPDRATERAFEADLKAISPR